MIFKVLYNRIKSKIMSYSEDVNNAVNSVVQKYIENVAKRYNLDKKDLYNIWSGGIDSGIIVKQEEPEDDDFARFMKCSVKELKDLCKKSDKKYSGSKSLLVGRLLEKEVKSIPKPENIVKQIQKKVPIIQLRRNKYGNFEHPETNFVFVLKKGDEKEVIGKQIYDEQGTVADLIAEDFELCKKFKFRYILPDNLDKNDNNLDDVSVDELDSDESKHDNVSEDEIVIEDDSEEIEVEEYADDFDEEYYEDDD